MKVIVKYSETPPYLPVAVADTMTEMAKITGVTISAVWHGIERHGAYRIVEIDEESEG